MGESSGGGELGIGLQDISNAKKRLNNSDGLNEQIEFNQKQLDLRVIASFFTLLIMGTLLSWLVGMPDLIKYSITVITLISSFVYLTLYLKKRSTLSKVREEQLGNHRYEKASK